MRLKFQFTFFLIMSMFIAHGAESSKKKIAYYQPDTIYYNFYDDVQMIEVDFHRSYMLDHQLGPMERPTTQMGRYYKALGIKNNILLFRNRDGEIIKRFNDRGNTVKSADLIPIEELTEYAYHNRPRNQSFVGNSLEKSPSTYVFMETKSEVIDRSGRMKSFSYFGIIDSLGNELMAARYRSIYVVGSKYFVDNGITQGVLNADLTDFVPPTFIAVQPSILVPGNMDIKSGDKWGMLDAEGKVVLSPIYTSIIIKSAGFNVTIDDKEGVVSFDGEEIIPVELDELHPFRKIYVAAKNGKFGILNSDFEPLVGYIYENLRPSKKGTDNYEVLLNGKWGLIHEDGKLLIPCTYDDPSHYKGVKLKN